MSKIYPTQPPCYGCDKRTAECHIDCVDYKTWAESGVEEYRHYFSENIEKKMIKIAKAKARK